MSGRPPKNGLSLRERLEFHSIPEPMSGCVLWTASTDGKAGYGKLRWAGRMQYAHRLAFESRHGASVLTGVVLRHRCDVPSCINPEHLEIGSQAENVADSFRRGRASQRSGDANNSARLTAAAVSAIRALHAEEATGVELAEKFGVSQSQISNVINHRHWKDI